MTIFFTADTHFGDHRTINIQRRPFADTAAMDVAMIERWNAVVAPEDFVWHLGDVARRPEEVSALMARLNGTKHLLRGNNDPDDTMAGWQPKVGRASATMRRLRSTVITLCCATIRSAAGMDSTRAH